MDWVIESGADAFEVVAALGEVLFDNGTHPDDLDQVLYVVEELIDNALDHSGQSQVELSVQSRGPTLIVTVSDSGVGIYRRVSERHPNMNEAEAVRWAFGAGNTTTNAPRGYGLAESAALTEREGYALLLETGGVCIVASDGELCIAGKSSNRVTGTTVQITIRVGAP